MTIKYGIIDLFAGPGGLGEGFARAGQDAATPMDIRMSIEMDEHAVATLRLRSFLRSFDGALPAGYYYALNLDQNFDALLELDPTMWQVARDEVGQLVLGAPGVFDSIASKLDATREECNGDTILIGGPPCQAYSLADRSRNMGKLGYVPEDADRQYLWRKNVRILHCLRPS